MIKYEDYFPKSTLNKCGILPESKLFDEDDLSTLSSDLDKKKVDELINNIYTRFKNSSTKIKNSDEEFKQFNVTRRIVSMLGDLDIISSETMEKYLNKIEQKPNFNDELTDEETRINIELPELNINSIYKDAEKSEKVISNDNLNLEIKGKQKWAKYFVLAKI